MGVQWVIAHSAFIFPAYLILKLGHMVECERDTFAVETQVVMCLACT